MDETSVLQTRFQDGTEESPPSPKQTSVQDATAQSEQQQQLDVAESFLTFVDCVINSGVRVQQRLESMQLCPTLGEGASFTVKRHFRAEKQIIKVSRQSYSTDTRQAFNRNAFSVLMKEIRILSHKPLRDCANIVKIQGLGWSVAALEPLELCPSLYLEEAPHRTLADFEKSGVTIDVATRFRLCLDASSGIEALHACGIVHGDVKADNVLIFDNSDGGYMAKVSDFGCAIFLQKYADVDPLTPVRMPGISRPWCAPESLDLVPVDQLPCTDIYSLGLLIFRLLVFCNPFDIFDLPVDRDPRVQYVTQLLSLPHFPELAALFIEEHLEKEWTRAERLGLTSMFSVALAQNPKSRQLSHITGLLKLLSEEPASFDGVLSLIKEADNREAIATDGTTDLSAAVASMRIDVKSTAAKVERPPMDIAKPPVEKLPLLDFDPDIVWGLPFEVRRQIQTSLDDMFRRIIEPGCDKENYYSTEKRESICWTLFQFKLLGLGAYEPDVEKAMQVLYYAGSQRGGHFWKAWSILTPLQEALQVQFEPDQMDDIAEWTTRASVTEGLTQRLLGSPIKQEFQNEIHVLSHGVTELELERVKRITVACGSGAQLHEVEECVAEKHDFGGRNSILHVAAIYGDLELTRTAIDCNGVLIDAKNDKSETPLMLACEYGHLSVTEHFLDRGSDASICTEYGVNALYWLSSFPKEEVPRIARRLVEAGASLQHVFSDKEKTLDMFDDGFLHLGRVNRSPLLRAIGNGDLISCQTLLELSLEPFGHEDRAVAMMLCFLQPMRLAALFHHHEILNMLCSHLETILKSFVSEQAAPSWRSTEVACFVRMVKSDAVACEALSMTHHAERLCVHGGRWRLAARDTLDVLIQYGLLRQTVIITNRYGANIPMDTLQSCAANGNTCALQHLLQHREFSGIINKVDTDYAGTTLVDVALDRSNLAVFKVLLEAGAELDLSRSPNSAHRLAVDGSSYLHVCASNRITTTDFAIPILDAGVPAGISNNTGVSALTLAVMKGNFPLARLLIQRGASVNTPGMHGYTTLGLILEPVISGQCDNLVSSVKFLLALEGEQVASFVVREETGSTALILASNALDPPPAEVEVFHLLLQKFCLPQHVNAPATTKPYSRPIQVAIFNHNLPAVKALIKAGVDLSVPDHFGEDSMTLAIRSINKLMVKETKLARRDVERDLNNALAIISAIADERDWPTQFKIGAVVSNILEEGAPLISVMRQLPHIQRQRLGLNGALTKVIDHSAFSWASLSEGLSQQENFATMTELQRQLDQALKPIFFSEVALDIFVISDVNASANFTPQQIREKTQAQIPILDHLTIKAFEMLQQSAAFEFILEQIHLGITDPLHTLQGDDELRAQTWVNYFRDFAETEDKEKLPYDWRFVRYPQTLHSWYQDRHLRRQLNLDGERDRQMIERFEDVLQRRADERARGDRKLSGFDEEFRDFHFNLLHGSRLSLQRLDPVLRVGCRCICMKPGKELGDISMEKAQFLNLAFKESLRAVRDEPAFEALAAHGKVNALDAAINATYNSWTRLKMGLLPQEEEESPIEA